MTEIEDIHKVLEAINHTTKRFYSPKDCPEIMIEEDGAKTKIHTSKRLWRNFISNTWIRGPMSATLYKCDKCNREFTDLDALTVHKRLEHEGVPTGTVDKPEQMKNDTDKS